MAVPVTLPFEAIYILSCPKYLKTRVPKVTHQLKALGFDSVPAHVVITPESELVMSTTMKYTGIGRNYAVWCAIGHMTAMNDMVCRGYKSALLLEDDVRFMNSREKMLGYLSEIPADFDIARMTCIPHRKDAWRWPSMAKDGNHWPMNEFRKSYDAGAYILSEKGATLLLQKYNEQVAQSCRDTGGHFEFADVVFWPSNTEEFRLNHYVAIPMLSRQQNGGGCSPKQVNDQRYNGLIDAKYGSTLEDYVWDFEATVSVNDIEVKRSAETQQVADGHGIDLVVIVAGMDDDTDLINGVIDSTDVKVVKRLVVTNPDSEFIDNLILRRSDANPENSRLKIGTAEARRAFGHYVAMHNAIDLETAATAPSVAPGRVLFVECGASAESVRKAVNGTGGSVSKDRSAGKLAYALGVDELRAATGRQDMFGGQTPTERRLPFLAIGELLDHVLDGHGN